jgi:hypothetical protein
MGCDIHEYAEQRVGDGWKCLNRVYEDNAPYPWLETLGIRRNYALFTLLAGVRGSSILSEAVRGIPDDLSPEIADVYAEWKDDAHSASWLYLSELKVLATKLLLSNEKKLRDRASRELTYLIDELKKRVPEDTPSTDVRLVFWFDN